jgi:hypothetical protein
MPETYDQHSYKMIRLEEGGGSPDRCIPPRDITGAPTQATRPGRATAARGPRHSRRWKPLAWSIARTADGSQISSR